MSCLPGRTMGAFGGCDCLCFGMGHAMTNVIQLKPKVSRDFMIGQSVKNAAAKHWPWGVQHFDTEKVLRDVMAATDWQIGFFADEVRLEYLILSDLYEEVPDVDDHGFTDGDYAGFEAALHEGRAFL